MLHQFPESALELIKPKAEEPGYNNEHSPKNNPVRLLFICRNTKLLILECLD